LRKRIALVLPGRDAHTRLLRDAHRAGRVGQTRLAIEVAAELVPAHRNGVFWVGLAPLRRAIPRAPCRDAIERPRMASRHL